MRFTKMEGLGNDYIYVNGFEETIPNPQKMSIRMSRFHYGCGSDGLILILPSEKADFRMKIFNSDGSEAEMCGNGVRCLAKYCHDRNLTNRTEFTVETGDGKIKSVRLFLNEKGLTDSVQVDMGTPELDGQKIPSLMTGGPILRLPISANRHTYAATLVNVGNPHAVCFVDDVENAPVTVDGPILEKLPVFPERINVEFVQVLDRNHLRMRVWERGSGETQACGTGATASVVAGILNGLCERNTKVALPGGELSILWDEATNHLFMTGPANFVYDGEWLQDENFLQDSL